MLYNNKIVPEIICSNASGIGNNFPISETIVANVNTEIRRPIKKPRQTLRFVVCSVYVNSTHNQRFPKDKPTNVAVIKSFIIYLM